MIRCTYFSLYIRINFTRILSLKFSKGQEYARGQDFFFFFVENTVACGRSVICNRRIYLDERGILFLFSKGTNYIFQHLNHEMKLCVHNVTVQDLTPCSNLLPLFIDKLGILE